VKLGYLNCFRLWVTEIEALRVKDVVVGLDEDGAMQHECREKDGSMKMLLGYLNSHNNFSFFKKKKNYIFFSFFINK
jgi:hypothetical protein